MTKGSILMIGNYLAIPRHNKNIWHGLAENLTRNGWNVITTSTKECQFLRLVDMLSSILINRYRYEIAQIDVFSGRAFIFAELTCLCLSLIKKPIILTLHGGRLPEFAKRNKVRMKLLLNRADLVVTPSPFHQKNLYQFRSDIRVIPNPIELTSTIFRLRRSVKPNLVWVRAFHETYNPSLAVKVLDQILKDYPDAKITMIGPDKGDGSLTRLLSLAKGLGIDDRVTIIPGVPNVKIPFFLDQNDIFINSSKFDTAPRSLIEAMANGLCIVSTDVGGIPYLVTDDEEALLVPSDKPEIMAQAVKRLLDEPHLAEKLSRNARHSAEGMDWSMILPQWENLFFELISSKNE